MEKRNRFEAICQKWLLQHKRNDSMISPVEDAKDHNRVKTQTPQQSIQNQMPKLALSDL